MANKYFMIVCLVLGLCGNGYAGIMPTEATWDVGGQWSVYGYAEATQNNDSEDEAVADTRLLLENDVSWEERNIYGVMDIEWRVETFHGMENETQSEVRFRDAYAELRRDHYNLSAGQKAVTWGKLDDLVVLDRVVPQDFTHFVLYDKQERKDPALMLHHQWFMDEDYQLETVFMPVFQASEVDFFGTNWAVFGHLKEAVAGSSDYSAAQKSIVSGISIREDDEVTDRSLDNGQLALRLRGRKNDIDYGVYYMNLYHSIPVLRETNPAGNLTKRFLYEPTAANLSAISGASGNDLVLTEAHPRIHTFGADWETVVGAFGVRGEMAVFLGMPFLEEDFAYTEKDQLSIGLGVDHTTDSQWYFDFQYVQDLILNYQGLYGVEEAPYQFAGTVSKDFVRGVIAADLDWFWNAAYGDWMLNPEFTYKWEKPGINMSVGAFIFQDGEPSSVFGRYDHNDVVYVKLSGEF